MNHIRVRALMRGCERFEAQGGQPSCYFAFALGHTPAAGDPYDLHAPHRQLLSNDDMELFRGPLVSADVTARLGRVREPCWLLLSCGVVMRSHACRLDGSGFMSFAEAERAIPAMVSRFSRARARAAWTQLIADLQALQVSPVAGEQVVDAHTIWRDGVDPSTSDGGGRLGDRAPLDGLSLIHISEPTRPY